MRSRVLLLGRAVVVAAWLANAAFAQDATGPPATQPAPADYGSLDLAEPLNQRRAGPMSLDELTLDLGFEGSFDQRTVKTGSWWSPPGKTRQINTAHGFEETLGLQASGNAWGEDVIQYDIAAEGGLSQEWYSELGFGPAKRQQPHGQMLEYDIQVSALPRGKVSADGFAQKLSSRVPRMFLPSLDRDLERYGGEVLLNDAKFPMRLSFEHLDETLNSRTGNVADNEKRGQDSFRYEGTWQATPNQSVRLEYEYVDRQEQYSGNRTEFDTRRNYLTLDHVWRFGKDNKSSWENLVRWQDETGSLGRDENELASRLRLQHTDKLSTNYAVQYFRDSFQRLQTDTGRAEAGATYQFDPSLTASLQGYGLDQRTGGGPDFCEMGSLTNLSYAKDNSLGRLSANFSYNRTDTQSRDGGQRGIVIAEAVTLIDPLSSFLAHTDVDVFSIVVTDATRTRTYLPWRDYLPIRVGRYMALQRLPLGAIADRQTVLVSYTYDVREDYRVARNRMDIRVEQAFKMGLTPYYAGSLQDEDVSRDQFLCFRERNVNRHRVGATYRRQKWSIGLEYEYNDDSIDPYQAVHGNGDVILFQNASNQIDGKATVSRFWFDGALDLAAHDTTLADLGVTFRSVLMRNLEANASAMYRYEDDSIYGLTHGVDLTGALDWRIGYFTLRFEAEYDLLHLPGSDDDSFGFWIKLKREIPVIGKGTGT